MNNIYSVEEVVAEIFARLDITDTRDTKFNLSSNIGGIHAVEIVYYALPINQEGMPIVREMVKEAVISFCEFQWIKRQRRRQPKLIPISEVDYYNNEWKLAKGTAKGRQKMVNPVQAEAILSKWMTMLPKFKTKNRHRGGGFNRRSVY